ncbi:MAG: nucleoside deaminase [Candidatus Eisenbacteria bacterium]|uniref:Nucleoside deaminase n=1 Tax=Eiseniibacteriota bacterium TaxID=2212470 RepID=A0A956NJM1_UNCEI|nr:nucleoside deaminase [Candidatus Eisenbacteria bacterium]MCB9466596.1 nucleoside deaminase [Candidatus Eisenbacteria bacterium]
MEEQFMREAIRLSRDKMRKNQGGPFGAIVVHGSEIVGRGWNQVTSANDPTAHAEVTAIRKACKKLGTFHLNGCVLYTSCEPCPMCLAAAYWARIDRIYFAGTRKDAARAGFDDEFLYREISKPGSRRSLPMEQLLRKEAVEAFEEWRTKADKTPY